MLYSLWIKFFLEEKKLITSEGVVMSCVESSDLSSIKHEKPQSQPSYVVAMNYYQQINRLHKEKLKSMKKPH